MKTANKQFHAILNKMAKHNKYFWISYAVLTLVCTMYLRYTWMNSVNKTSEELLRTAKIAAASMNHYELKNLVFETEFWQRSYENFHSRLLEIVQFENEASSAYIFTEREGRFYKCVDSEVDSFLEGHAFAEKPLVESSVERSAYQRGEPIIIRPKNNEEAWLQVLVPITDDETRRTIATLAIKHPSMVWKHNAMRDTIDSGFAVVAIYLAWFVFSLIFKHNFMLRQANKKIKKSEQKFYKAFHLNAALMSILSVKDGTYIDVNKTFLDTLGYKRGEIIGKKMPEVDLFVDTEERKKIQLLHNKGKNQIFNIEVAIKGKDQVIHHCLFSEALIDIDSTPCWLSMMHDITERKQAEEKIFYLSNHDQLTGVYNRRFYEEALVNFNTKDNHPLSVIMGDVNGLKLMNDLCGHVMGDELLKKVAKVMVRCCRTDDIVARIGGDEFVMILPKTNFSETKTRMERIDRLLRNEKVGAFSVSLALGHQTKYSEQTSFSKIIKYAEDRMYERKLSTKIFKHDKKVGSIINYFHKKNSSERQHAYRVAKLCERMGYSLGFSEIEVLKLKLIALVHDIGKVGIHQGILNKPGKLTADEWDKMKAHSEVGYRIINSANDLSDMALCVLAHHERWDGKGYPNGLEKDEIPLSARIIAIIDAYDAMISDRVYQKGVTKVDAIKELRANAGTQFDAKLVEIFINKVI